MFENYEVFEFTAVLPDEASDGHTEFKRNIMTVFLTITFIR